MIILARSLLFAFATPQRALFDSQYHIFGPLIPAFSQPAEELFCKNGELKRALQNLEVMRRGYAQAKATGSQKYTQAYGQLCRCLEDGFEPNPSLYRLVGWYNVTSLHNCLLQRLISLKEDPEPLIESVAWMKPISESPYGFIKKELRENRKIQGLYRNLKLSLSIKHLRQLESIVLSPLTISKRTYMELYSLKNLQGLLKGGSEAGSDIVWLFEAVTSAMVDRPDLTSKFQAFLKFFSAATSEDCESLMRTYSLRGRIDKSLYQLLIRPYLLRHKMKDSQGIVEAIKFTILSESEDYLLVKNLFEQLNTRSICASKQLYQLHILTHYLRMRRQSIHLGAELQKRLVDFCSGRSEAKATINQLVLACSDTKQKEQRSEFISECLTVKKHRLVELQSTGRSAFEEAFSSRLANTAAEHIHIYEKVSFCCFELDYCVYDSHAQKLIDMEVEGLQYVFSSGRLTRWQQIRQELLEYYGIQVNRFRGHSFQQKPYLNCLNPPRKSSKLFTKK